MNHETEFRIFLAGIYSKKVVSDIVSRCKKVEKEFSIILPASQLQHIELCKSVKENGDKFGKWSYAYNQYIHAINAYSKFLVLHGKDER